MKLCIAEKPSVAKDLAHILGAKYRHDGYFEGNGYCVSWTFGHLCTLKEPDDYHPTLKQWRLQSLPIIPPQFGIKLIQRGGIEKQFKTIENLVTKADSIINCGDAGQEGELIQRWVLQKANNTKPVQRLWISSLTEEAIREGFSNLKDAADFDNLYAAGSVRAIGDWLLGINATRLYTLKYGQNKQVLSVGRVQTPTLALIVNRHLEIENFTPEAYWELKTKYRNVLFSARKGRYLDKEKAELALTEIRQAPFTVESFTKKKGKEYAPKLFDLTSLQVECNRKLGYSAEETLKYVQGLYEKKHVSYPRVDTTYLPNDMFPKIKGILNSLVGYSAFTSPITSKPIVKTKRVFDDKKVTDHHAIIPTNVWPGGSNLMEYEKRVYDIITRRFIANFMEDCDVSKTEVLGDISKIGFKATGRQVINLGWRTIYSKDKKEVDDEEEVKKEESQDLPEFTKGESGMHTPLLGDKMTSPPKPLTEATLLRAMETAGKQIDDDTLREALKENGIGRPSTRANIIETLFRRKYIVRKRKTLLPTPTGIELIATIDNDLLKSAQLTGEWEQKMRLIERGEYEVKTFMNELKDMVTTVVNQVKIAQNKKITITENTEEEQKTKKSTIKKTKQPQKPLKCPKCNNGSILKGSTAFGCSAFKTGCDFRVPFILFDKKLTTTQTDTLIRKGKSPLIKGIPLNGDKKEGYFLFDKAFNIRFEEKENH